MKITLTLILCLLPLVAYGKTSCPTGSTECDAPCGSYIDYDEDGNCDHLPTNLQAKNTLTEIKPEPLKPKPLKKEVQVQKKQIIKKPLAQKEIIKTLGKKSVKKTPQKKSYRLFPIALSLILLYIITIILHKKKIIEPRTHFKFWNFALLLTFLISALLGIFLVILINYGIRLKLPFNIMLWHTEAGITMFTISLFHIHWHWRYIKNIFKIIK